MEEIVMDYICDERLYASGWFDKVRAMSRDEKEAYIKELEKERAKK